jgi:hypothetical protein
LKLLAEINYLCGWVLLRQFLQWNKISADQHGKLACGNVIIL